MEPSFGTRGLIRNVVEKDGGAAEHQSLPLRQPTLPAGALVGRPSPADKSVAYHPPKTAKSRRRTVGRPIP